MRKSVFIAALWLGACGSATTQSTQTETPSTQASQASIDGAITSSAGSLTVSVVGTNLSTTTDSAGNFALVDVPAGATELHITGPGVDATLTITAVMSGEHRTISVTATGTTCTEHHEQSDSEFRGKVESIDAANTALTVAGRTVTTTSTTTYSKAGQPAAFTDIVVGDAVEVEGAVQADGSVVATKIEIAPAAPAMDSIVFVAKVQSVDATNGKLTAGDIPVTVSSTTVLVQAQKTITLADIKVGDFVRVKGQLEAGPSVNASEIRDLTPTDAVVRVFGAITAIAADSTSLTIGQPSASTAMNPGMMNPTPSAPSTTTVVAVDANTVYRGDGDPKSLADLKVGDLVMVEAARQSDGSLLAKAVTRLPLPPPPPANIVILSGALTAVDATAGTASIGTDTFKVDSSTFFGGYNDPKSLADLKVGDLVVVKAIKQTDGSILAGSVVRMPPVPSTPMPNIARGTLSAVGTDSITLTLASDPSKSQTYSVNAHTIIRIGDKPGTLADLKVGQTVEVGSMMASGSTTPVAMAIHVLP